MGFDVFKSGVLDRLEKGAHGIVVSLQDGVALVVMALGAVECHAQEGFTCNIDDITDHVCVCLGAVSGFVIAQHQGKKTGGDTGGEGGLGDLVPCKLLGEEAVIGQILVEGVNDVVTVAPDFRFDAVTLVAIGFCVTHGVEPE